MEPGDSLARIAELCDTTIAALEEVNNLSSHILQVGQTLTIPAGTLVVEVSSSAAPVVQQNRYTVQSGDSWARIAQRNGISVEALQQANAALDSLVLQPGQQIVLPAGAGESASSTPTVTQSPAPVVPAVARTNVLGGERLALANYFTWYGGDIWYQGVTWDTPVIPYLSLQSEAIDRHINWAQQAGLDGFVVYWWHAADQTSANFFRLLEISRGRNFHSAINFQGHIIPGVTYEDVVGNLSFILKLFRDDPNYLRINGKPLIFFSDMPRVPLPQNPVVVWSKIRAEVDPEHQSIWIAEGLDPSYLTVFDGLFIFKIDHACCPILHNNAPAWAGWTRYYARQTGEPKLWIATIQPGWDDTNWNQPDLREPSPSFAIDRDEGAYYRETFDAVKYTNPDLLLVNSFNEWVEGSQIEPGNSYGDLYLRLTAELVAEYKQR